MAKTFAQLSAAVVARGKTAVGKWRYANYKPQKLDPEKYGFSDCSGFLYWCYKGIGIELSDMSYKQAVQGTEVASGTTLAGFMKIVHLIEPGDEVCMALKAGWNGGADINHVEMAIEKGSVLSLGHGSGTGPQYHNLTVSWLIPDAKSWTIRRHIPADKTTAPATPLTGLEKVIAQMKATHVIFKTEGGVIGIADVLAGKYELFKTRAEYERRRNFLKQSGAKLRQYKTIRTDKNKGKTNVVQDLARFGTRG